MAVNGRKPPERAKPTVTTVEPVMNAKSCVGNQIEEQNTMVEPTRPDTINMDVIVRKFTAYGMVGFTRPHMGITIAASTVEVTIKKRNSKNTWLIPYIQAGYNPKALSAARNFLSAKKTGMVLKGKR